MTPFCPVHRPSANNYLSPAATERQAISKNKISVSVHSAVIQNHKKGATAPLFYPYLFKTYHSGAILYYALLHLLQILLCAAIVNRVSASCVRVAPSRFISSSVSLQAIALATTVMEAVNSHEFTKISPPHLSYERMVTECIPAPAATSIRTATTHFLPLPFS